MKVLIFKKSGILLASVSPDDSSELVQTQQSENYVRLIFKTESPVDFSIGDFLVFGKFDAKYELKDIPEVSGTPYDWKYECIFTGDLHKLEDTICLMRTPKIGGGYYLDYSFPLTGTAETFLAFLVEVLNQDGNPVTVGSAQITGTILVEFSNWTVKQALDYIAGQFETSWYIEANTLHLSKKTTQISTLFQTGNYGGLLTMQRLKVDKQLITVLYAYGETSNLPPRSGSDFVYDSSTLHENRLSFIGIDGESKLVKNKDLYGSRTLVKEFPIKPEHTGSVTSLGVDIFTFFDKNYPFDINTYLLDGITPKITFLDGLLAGVEFSLTYDSISKKIEIIPTTNGSTVLPNDVCKIQEGNTYVIFDISYPSEYIKDAELRLKEAADAYLDTYATPAAGYEATIDERFIQKNELELSLGDVVRIVNSDMRVDAFFEIKELTREVVEDAKYSIKFGDIQPYNLISKLSQQSFYVNNTLNQIKQSAVTNTSILNITGDSTTWQDL